MRKEDVLVFARRRMLHKYYYDVQKGKSENSHLYAVRREEFSVQV
jgi:hypothetical protein